MKVASVIFIILGMLLNFLYNWVFGLIGVVVGIWMLVSLESNQKSTAAGVLGLIFTGLIGGILYLCWDPNK